MMYLITSPNRHFRMGILLGLLLYGGISVVLLVLCIMLYFNFQHRSHRKYFENQGIPYYSPPSSALFRGKTSLIELEKAFYKEGCKSGKPILGISDISGPKYYVTDVDLMRHIYVKDFDHFMNRRKFSTLESDIFTKMLLTMDGERWKALRSKLSPTFTTSKIRSMFSIFERSSLRLCEYIKQHFDDPSRGGDIDICKFYSKYAMDVIASCAFGVDSKSFEMDPDLKSEFEEMGTRFQFKIKLKLIAKIMLITFFPNLARILKIQPFDRDAQEYFSRVIKTVIMKRRESGEKQNDFLQLMIDAQDDLLDGDSKEALEIMTGSQTEAGGANKSFGSQSSLDKLKLDDDIVVANCILFFLAGYDTLQSLIIFATFALAKEQEVQEKLLQEVKRTLEENGGKLTYEAMTQMSYLDLFINETLRYYAPSMFTERVCSRDYRVPGTDWVIEKGRYVSMSVYAMHHDEKYYENPDKFIPERFLPENKNQRHPYAFSPFGHGPRNCIGMRFALTEAKTVIAHIVHQFKIEPCSKTDMPPKFDNNPVLKPKNGMWLRLQPRK